MHIRELSKILSDYFKFHKTKADCLAKKGNSNTPERIDLIKKVLVFQ